MVRELLKEIAEVARYRELLKNLVLRDLKVRYRRSVLGFVWVMLNPLLMMLVLSVIFSEIFKVSTKNYTVYLLSGIIMWNFFAQSTGITVHAFLANRDLIKKVYIPRSIFPLSVLLSALVNFVFSLVPLIVIMVATGTPVSMNFYFVPFCLALVFVFSFGVALVLSTLTVFFHDIVYIYDVLLLAWMYATPVFYPASIVPERFRVLLDMNPMYHLLTLFRGGLYLTTPAMLVQAAYGLLFSAGSLLIGSLIYIRLKDRLVYYL